MTECFGCYNVAQTITRTHKKLLLKNRRDIHQCPRWL